MMGYGPWRVWPVGRQASMIIAWEGRGRRVDVDKVPAHSGA